MPSDYPTSLATIRRILPGDYMDGAGTELDLAYNKIADEVEAVQARVGIAGSTVPTSIEKRLADAQAVAAAAAVTVADVQQQVGESINPSAGTIEARLADVEALLAPPEGVLVNPFVSNVTNVASVVPLAAGVDELSFYYSNSSGDAGVVMVVLDALSALDAAAKMDRNGAHIRLNPGERSPTYRISQLTPVSSVYLKSVSALTTGSNEVQITQHGELLLPDTATGGYSSKLKFWARCVQSTADAFLQDSSVGANHVTFEAALSGASAWASSAGLTLPALTTGAKTYPIIPQAVWNTFWSYAAGDSFLIHFKCDVTPGASTLPLIGSGYSTTGGNQGFQIRIAATGVGNVTFGCYGVSAIVYSTNPVASISSGEHSVCVFYNGQTKQVSIYIDGLADSIGNSLSSAGEFTSSRGVLIGGRFESSGAVHTGPAGVYRDIQMYFWPASAPSADTVTAIASRLHTVNGPLLLSELP